MFSCLIIPHNRTIDTPSEPLFAGLKRCAGGVISPAYSKRRKKGLDETFLVDFSQRRTLVAACEHRSGRM